MRNEILTGKINVTDWQHQSVSFGAADQPATERFEDEVEPDAIAAKKTS